MPAIVCLLRGVNLGGHNLIKMDDLRALCASLKCRNPQTYVQSGNVVFESGEKNQVTLSRKIAAAIERKCGFRPSVILRTAAELRGVVQRNPFAGRSGIEPGKLLVTFLAEKPARAAAAALKKRAISPEELHLIGSEIYVYFPNGAGRSRLNWSSLDKTLQTTGTARNWNTVTKLLAMAEAIESMSSH